MSLLCPHCERPLDAEHDEKACQRKMSRRFFFGVAFGGLMAAVAKEAPAKETVWWLKGNAGFHSGVVLPSVTITFCPTKDLFNLPYDASRGYYSGDWLRNGVSIKTDDRPMPKLPDAL